MKWNNRFSLTQHSNSITGSLGQVKHVIGLYLTINNPRWRRNSYSWHSRTRPHKARVVYFIYKRKLKILFQTVQTESRGMNVNEKLSLIKIVRTRETKDKRRRKKGLKLNRQGNSAQKDCVKLSTKKFDFPSKSFLHLIFASFLFFSVFLILSCTVKPLK